MMDNKSDTKLDLKLATFFDAAKAVDNIPNAGFLDAVILDALNQTKQRTENAGKTLQSPPWWAVLLRSIGGWQSATALAVSAFLGITAGYATPNALNYFDSGRITAGTLNDDSFSVMSDIETLFQEG